MNFFTKILLTYNEWYSLQFSTSWKKANVFNKVCVLRGRLVCIEAVGRIMVNVIEFLSLQTGWWVLSVNYGGNLSQFFSYPGFCSVFGNMEAWLQWTAIISTFLLIIIHIKNKLRKEHLTANKNQWNLKHFFVSPSQPGTRHMFSTNLNLRILEKNKTKGKKEPTKKKKKAQ